jgi:hypothetical protein
MLETKCSNIQHVDRLTQIYAYNYGADLRRPNTKAMMRLGLKSSQEIGRQRTCSSARASTLRQLNTQRPRFCPLPDVNSTHIVFRSALQLLPSYHIVFPSACLPDYRLRTSYTLSGHYLQDSDSTLFTPTCLLPNIINDTVREIHKAPEFYQHSLDRFKFQILHCGIGRQSQLASAGCRCKSYSAATPARRRCSRGDRQKRTGHGVVFFLCADSWGPAPTSLVARQRFISDLLVLRPSDAFVPASPRELRIRIRIRVPTPNRWGAHVRAAATLRRESCGWSGRTTWGACLPGSGG